MPPASPCRYHLPLPTYGRTQRCKSGRKSPCDIVPECWAKTGGDVLGSIHCQQEYVRDLAEYLFDNDQFFRNVWLEHEKVIRLSDLKNKANYGKNYKEAYETAKKEYDSGRRLGVTNNTIEYAKRQLNMLIAGNDVISLEAVPEFRKSLFEFLKGVFSSIFVFKDGQIDFQTPPGGKVCTDLEPYFTFIKNMNILLIEGRTTRTGGRKTRTRKSKKRNTRRRRL